MQGQLEQALPPRAQPLAGPAAVGLQQLAVRGAEELLGRPRAQALWEEANRRAHGRFMDLIEGGGESVSTEGGDVTLDLKALLGETAERFGVGGRAEAQIPDDAAQITILHADRLQLAQDAVRFLRAVAFVLLALALGLFALAVYVARGWRREALRACGIGFLFAGAARARGTLTCRRRGRRGARDDRGSRPAADAVWSISTGLLVDAAAAAIAYGVVIVGAAWLAGPTSAGQWRRGAASPRTCASRAMPTERWRSSSWRLLPGNRPPRLVP